MQKVRADTIFECWQETPLAELVHSIYMWAQGPQVLHVVRITNLTRKASIKFFQKLHNCCSSWLLRNPVAIGCHRLNYVVEIDESQFHY